jgi:Family of unknown function (DUF6599)
MTKRCIHVGLVLFALAFPSFAQDRTTLLQSLGETPGLEPTAPPKTWESSTLEQFDPSLASHLKLYGFKGITAQEWKTAKGPVKITLYQMNDSPAAYGAYTLLRSRFGGEPTPTLIGASSVRWENQLHFWQSNYAVRIDGTTEAQDGIAQVLSRKILGSSRKPPVSEYLPAANIVSGTEKYVLSSDAIDPKAGLDSEKLGFDFSAEAATAAYRLRGTTAHLLLVLYPTQHIAKKHTDELESRGRVPAAFLKRAGPLVAFVYGTRDETVAGSILDGVSHEFKVTWNEPQPGLALGPMIITIFTFIGVALAFTTAVGLSFGGLRVFVKSRYPNRVFDRADTMELIQLKLVQGVTDRRIGSNDGGGGA